MEVSFNARESKTWDAESNWNGCAIKSHRERRQSSRAQIAIMGFLKRDGGTEQSLGLDPSAGGPVRRFDKKTVRLLDKRSQTSGDFLSSCRFGAGRMALRLNRCAEAAHQTSRRVRACRRFPFSSAPCPDGRRRLRR